MQHTFVARTRWQGSTAGGYDSYSRELRAESGPTEFGMSAHTAFRGDAALLNPEQLLVLSASSCQLLSFLAVAARAGVNVLGYEDEAVATMSTRRATDGPMHIERIVLSPVVHVAAGTDPDAVAALLEQGHDECFIANSLKSEIVLEPTVLVGN